jgi:hypothetical protein
VRAGDEAALALVREHGRDRDLGPSGFPLASAQLVIARRHAFASWPKLRHYVQVIAARSWDPDAPPPAGEPLADRFLRLACLSYSSRQPLPEGLDPDHPPGARRRHQPRRHR